MLGILKRNTALLLLLAAALLLFASMTLPAVERRRALAEEHRTRRIELQAREAELQRLDLLHDALLQGDAAQLDRAMQRRFAPPASFPLER